MLKARMIHERPLLLLHVSFVLVLISLRPQSQTFVLVGDASREIDFTTELAEPIARCFVKLEIGHIDFNRLSSSLIELNYL